MSDITISAALRRIAALKGESGRLIGRRSKSIVYRVDSPPAWSLEEIETGLSDVRKELLDLKARLAVANATNYVTVEGESRTLTSCVTELQELKGQIASDEALLVATKARAEFNVSDTEWTEDGGRRTVEVAYKCDLTTKVLDERIAALRERFAMINASVEDANHKVTV